MKNIFKYLKNIFKVLIWPIIFTIGQFLLILIFGFIFNTLKYNDIKLANGNANKEQLTTIFQEYIKTNEYKTGLQEFINSNALLITLITFVIFFIIFYKIYKKNKNDYQGKLSIQNILLLITLGLFINISYNLIMSNINSLFKFTNAYDGINTNIIIYLICTGILGPILEELLFRGIVYNKLKTFNKTMTSIVLTSVIFALFHQTFIQILYTFCLSFILIYAYEKYKTIVAPIIIHIASNIINLFICMLIIKENMIVNTIVLVLSLAILLLVNLKIIKSDLSNCVKCKD